MRSIRALSIRQPGANRIADGVKTIEVRTWATRYRGPVLIVSSKKPNIEPAGCALAVVDLVDCQPMREEHTSGACCDLYPECFSWILGNVRKIRPFPMRGSLGLYGVDADLLDLDPDDRRDMELRLSHMTGNLTLGL